MLTERQQRFVAAYRGNAAQAAREAGYSGSPHALAVAGSRLLRHPAVAAALEERQVLIEAQLEVDGCKGDLATTRDQQVWLTSVMRDESAPIELRLKAQAQLAKIQRAPRTAVSVAAPAHATVRIVGTGRLNHPMPSEDP